MKAIILAAGRGSRMKNMTDSQPKCLIKLRGKALLDWQLAALYEAGIQEIAIVTGYKRELLSNRGLIEFHNDRWAVTNMVSSLERAAQWLEAGPCIVSYSDLFYEPVAVQSLMRTQAAVAVTYDPNWRQLWEKRFVDPLLDAETFRLDANGILVEIGQKPKSIAEVQGQYMGLLRFTPEGWAEVSRIRETLLETERDRMHMTGTLQMVVEAARVPVVAVPYQGEWGEVDSVEDISIYDPEGIS